MFRFGVRREYFGQIRDPLRADEHGSLGTYLASGFDLEAPHPQPIVWEMSARKPLRCASSNIMRWEGATSVIAAGDARKNTN